MSLSFMQYVAEVIHKEIKAVGESLLSGDAASFDDYKHITGKLQGLEWARVALIDAYGQLHGDKDQVEVNEE